MEICRSCDREATVEYGEDYPFCDECSERFLKDVAKCYLAPKIEIEQGECPKSERWFEEGGRCGLAHECGRCANNPYIHDEGDKVSILKCECGVFVKTHREGLAMCDECGIGMEFDTDSGRWRSIYLPDGWRYLKIGEPTKRGDMPYNPMTGWNGDWEIEKEIDKVGPDSPFIARRREDDLEEQQ